MNAKLKKNAQDMRLLEIWMARYSRWSFQEKAIYSCTYFMDCLACINRLGYGFEIGPGSCKITYPPEMEIIAVRKSFSTKLYHDLDGGLQEKYIKVQTVEAMHSAVKQFTIRYEKLMEQAKTK